MEYVNLGVHALMIFITTMLFSLLLLLLLLTECKVSVGSWGSCYDPVLAQVNVAFGKLPRPPSVVSTPTLTPCMVSTCREGGQEEY